MPTDGPSTDYADRVLKEALTAATGGSTPRRLRRR
jgi:hypothetical protein